jgi:hypothetical protein
MLGRVQELLTPAHISSDINAIVDDGRQQSGSGATEILYARGIVHCFFNGQGVFILHGKSVLSHAGQKLPNVMDTC